MTANNQHMPPVTFTLVETPPFTSPSGGKLPGTATHVHHCRHCTRFLPCDDDCHTVGNAIWGSVGCILQACAMCKLEAHHAKGSDIGHVYLSDDQPSGPIKRYGVHVRKCGYHAFVAARPEADAIWIAHEVAKALLRQAGLEAHPARWG